MRALLHCLQSLFHIPVFREVILDYQPPSLPNGMSEVPPPPPSPPPPPPPTHTYTPTLPHLICYMCCILHTPHPSSLTSLTPHISQPSHPSPLTSLTPHIPHIHHPSHPSLTLDNCTLFTLNPSSPHPFTPSTPSPLTHPHTLTVSPVCAFCSGTSKVVCPPPPK